MKREHLFSITKKDLEIQTFRCGGKGGQHQNKRDTGVRIIHRESGLRAESREERSQAQNKKIAFKRLVPLLKKWCYDKAQELIQERDIEAEVDRMMHPDNLRVEIKEDGVWINEGYND